MVCPFLKLFPLEQNQELTYYTTEDDVKPNGQVSLMDALVSNITIIKEREHSFSVQTAPPDRTLFFSTNTPEQSAEWREAIIAACKKNKQKMAQASFKPKKRDFKSEAFTQQQSSEGGSHALWRRDSWDENQLLIEANEEEGDDMPGFFDMESIKRMRGARSTVGALNSARGLSINPFK